MAQAAARFAESCLRAMAGEGGVVECAFVASSLVPGLPYLASPLRLGPDGIAGAWLCGAAGAGQTGGRLHSCCLRARRRRGPAASLIPATCNQSPRPPATLQTCRVPAAAADG